MSKYIDADKLKAEIEKLLAKAKNDEEKAFAKKDAAGHLVAVTKTAVCVKIKKIIASLQQEQPELSNEFEIAINRRLNLINGENLTATELLEETKGMTAELLDLAHKVIEKEQPEVDLEKEIDRVFFQQDCGSGRLYHKEIAEIARHFYELGLNARK